MWHLDVHMQSLDTHENDKHRRKYKKGLHNIDREALIIPGSESKLHGTYVLVVGRSS